MGGSKPKKPDPIPQAAPITQKESAVVKEAGQAERRRLNDQFNRSDTVTSRGFKTIFG